MGFIRRLRINQLGFRNEFPETVYETINEVAFAKNWESDFANIITYEQQREARKAYGLSSDNLNNLSAQEAIDKINHALSSYEYEIKPGEIEPPRSLEEMMMYTEEHMRMHFSDLWENIGADSDAQLRDGKIVSLFTLFETLGFWSDSKRTYKKGSRLPDSRHAFNGSYFTKVISRDKKFLMKSEAAYSYFNIETQNMHTEEFKMHLKELLH